MDEEELDTKQCTFCYDLYGSAAAPDDVKANSKNCSMCNLLAQVCSIHEANTGVDAALLLFSQLRSIHGIKIQVLGAGNSSAHASYRLVAASQEIPRLPFDLPIRRIFNLTPSIDEVAKRVSFWLSCCDRDHELCTANRQTRNDPPARLLNVGTVLDPTISVVDFPTTGAKYVALSYCWGKAKQVKLTDKNANEFRLAVPEDLLPQTIKDAINLTRKLGIHHIWVDALCIIQDNSEDWKVEAAKMANVYGGAYVVLSADRAQSCDSGFLGPRRFLSEVLDIGSDDRNPKSMYAFILGGNTVETCERMHNFILSGYLSEQSLAATCPVYDRGWCLQEQVLATRLVHFTENEMVFECAEAIDCECSALSGKNFRQCLPENPPELPPRQRKAYWHQTRISKDQKRNSDAWWSSVEQYTWCHLSVETDRLPAMSGIAQLLSECDLGKYYAGLWELDLPSGLLWAVKHGFTIQPRRPAQYAAPTWSWASVMAPIMRPDASFKPPVTFGTGKGSDGEVLLPKKAEVIRFESKLSSQSPFGGIIQASLAVRATVITLEARSISEQGQWHDYLEFCAVSHERSDGAKEIVAHYPLHSCRELDLFRSRESNELNAYLEPLELRGVLIDYYGPALGVESAYSFGALLVVPSNQMDGAFERIGRVTLWIDGRWKRQVMEPKEILLV